MNLISSALLPRLVTSKSMGPAAVTLLSNGELDTLALRQADPRLLTANDAGIMSGILT